MFKDCNFTILDNPEYFEFENGLWTGKHQPFKTVNVIRNTNFSGLGKIDTSDIAQIEVELKKFEKRKLKEGDIVIERSGGGPKQPVGRVVYFDVKNGDYSFSNFTSRIRVIRQDIFNPKFIFYYLLNFYQAGKTENLQARTTGIRNLDFNNYKQSVEIPVLSTPEQCNIAHILSKIQSAIETQEKIIQTTTELKKALMQKLFTEGLKGEPQKETEIGLVPRSWEVKRVEDVYNFTNKPRGTALGVVKQVPFIPMDLIPDDSLFVRDFELRDVDDLSSGTYIENGDLLIAKITPSFENGKQAIVDFEYKFGFATTEVIPIKEKAKISNKHYLYYYLLKSDVRSMLAGKMEGSTGRQRLSKTVLGGTLIPCPSYKEQTEIAEIFIKVDNKIQFCRTKVVSLQSLFKSMLHHLMTGQIRVKDLRFS